MRIQYAIPPGGPKNGPPDLRVELTKNFEGATTAGKGWFANNNHGSEAGLSIIRKSENEAKEEAEPKLSRVTNS